MKMTAPQSLKFSKLKRRLAIPHWQAVGLLESVWLFTQVNAPAGDIGKHANDDIAAGLEWSGSADDLINALVECGWLDWCEVNRIVVHDWQDHVPKYLKGAMAKNGKEFVNVKAKQPAKPRKQPAKQPKQRAPSLALPRVDNPNLGESFSSADAVEEAKPRPRDLLFDAIAEVTAADPATAASHIVAVKKAMLKAVPPYTPEEIREFGRRYQELCTWGPRDGRVRPELGELQKHIGKIRAAPIAILETAKPPPKSFGEQKTERANALLDALTEKPKPEIAEGESRVA